jgi:hypothetical protein
MAGKTTSLGKQTKQGKNVSSARSRKTGEKSTVTIKKAAANKKVVAVTAGAASAVRKKSSRKSAKTGKEPERDLDTAIKGGREIKGEVPEALAYFLEVYGRLGRG